MFAKQVGLDLGTAHLRVYVRGRGILLQEPTVVAHAAADDRVLAIGREARAMEERTPPSILVTRPIRAGVVADYGVTLALLRAIFQHVAGRAPFSRVQVMIAVPAGITTVESRAILDAALQAGARQAYLLPAPVAAAIGAGVPIASPGGNLLLNLGAGITQAAVLSLNDIVIGTSLRQGGDRLCELIVAHVKRQHGVLIGLHTAEEIKERLGSALPLPADTFADFAGLEVGSARPRSVTLGSWEITEALRDGLSAVLGAVHGVLAQTPPELVSDVVDKGMLLTGGGALLRNLDKLLTQEVGVPACLSEDPLTCVATGAGRVLEHLRMFRDSLLPVSSA